MQTKSSIYLRWQGYYDYTLDDIKKYVLKDPALPGVYKIAELETYSRLIPFYVGTSTDLYKTLTKHISDRETNKCIKKELKDKICCFKFAILMDEETRQDVAYTLYDHYHPLCNAPGEIKVADLANLNYQ